jgi:hypothetical protein
MEPFDQLAKLEEYQYPREDLLHITRTVNLISSKWWESWWSYIYSKSGNRPSFIDNTDLVEGQGSNWRTIDLKPGLQENRDYLILHPLAWKNLIKWYGGGPEIDLFVINGEVDVAPIILEVWRVSSESDLETTEGQAFLISTQLTVRQLQEYLCDKLMINFNIYEMSIIDSFSGESSKSLLGFTDFTLSQCNIADRSKIMLKEENSNFNEPPTYNALQNVEFEEAYAKAIEDSLRTSSLHMNTSNRFENPDENGKDEDIDLFGLNSSPGLRKDREEVSCKISKVMVNPKVKLRIRNMRRIYQEICCLYDCFQDSKKKSITGNQLTE